MFDFVTSALLRVARPAWIDRDGEGVMLSGRDEVLARRPRVLARDLGVGTDANMGQITRGRRAFDFPCIIMLSRVSAST